MAIDKSKLSKLKKMKMPDAKKSETDDLQGMEQDPMEGSPEEESMESPDMEKHEEDMGMDQDANDSDKSKSDGKENPELRKVSDDDLIAELKKRGLLEELEEQDEKGKQNDQSQYESPSSSDHEQDDLQS